jgi:hypothetical protein
MNSIEKDEFGVVKIFPDHATSPRFDKLDSVDIEFLPHLRYSSTKDKTETTDKNSVVSTRWTKSGREFISVEVTGYFYLPEIEPDGNKEPDVKYKPGGKGSALTIKTRGGPHTTKIPPDQTAKCYCFDFQYEEKGNDRNNFQKEYPHPDYYKMTVGTKFKLRGNLKKWVGYKAVSINEGNSVRCLAFVDYGSEGTSKENGPDLSLQKWKLYYDVTDDGKLADKFEIDHEQEYKAKSDVREPFTKHHPEDVAKKTIQFRMDRIVEPVAKFLSARRLLTTSNVNDIIKNY